MHIGGAENFLLKLVLALREERAAGFVISVAAGGGMARRFRDAGIELIELGLNGGADWWRLPRALHTIRAVVRRWRPDLIQGWMNHGNLAASFTRAIAAPTAQLVWGIRQTVYDIRSERFSTRVAIRLQSRISAGADAIVCNSHVGLEQHARLGFHEQRMKVIPNGFDSHKFLPRPDSRGLVRQSFGIAAGAFVVAMVARFHPMKDYRTFLEAVSLAVRDAPHLHALCIGRGVDAEGSGMHEWLTELGLSGHCTLLGERGDLDQLYHAVDVVCLTSVRGEGFPNVIGEAMSCSIPCIVTDVGDAARVVGTTGRVIEPRSPRAVADAILELLRMSLQARSELGARARERIVSEYSMSAVAGQYLATYASLVRSGELASRSIHEE